VLPVLTGDPAPPEVTRGEGPTPNGGVAWEAIRFAGAIEIHELDADGNSIARTYAGEPHMILGVCPVDEELEPPRWGCEVCGALWRRTRDRTIYYENL
jgi:hypothetical protein